MCTIPVSPMTTSSHLKLYRGDSLVEPGHVDDALTGAVEQVFFVICHYYLRDKKFDTFCAGIQQIKILKPGSSITCSGFNRRNACEGPFDIVKPASSYAKNDEAGRAEEGSKQVESK
ncbi:hypothetical protein K503DRAFT_860572 [Rhizopogon vinicolor AM-OR11-026]|uniref:Uncharacterized protein n=1 Tax=Rhizopogon vinicolor AM-OR11-026 TaxID=1314800 RepID=A0A1B7MH19_9AGAM|nr:hypothetical protein K503DRAFT_860572 [Rhizopogon vinicolor AM-OR11-026]